MNAAPGSKQFLNSKTSSILDNKNLHINNGNSEYPRPDVPVEDAWDNMKQLLQQVPAAPAAKSKFNLGKGSISQFITGAGAVAIVSVIVYMITIKKEQPTPSKTLNNIDTVSKIDTLQHDTAAYAVKVFEFRNTPFKEAARSIEKAYGVKIITKNNSLDDCTVTTRFDNKSLEEILDILGYTLAFEYKIDKKKNQVIITGDGCN
jgi:hypothetical protein